MQTPRKRFISSLATLCACGVMVLGASAARANPPTSLQSETGRGLSLGSGMRASSISTSALAYNPSAMPFGRLYHVESTADYSPNTDSLMLGAAVVDSLTSSFALGISARAMVDQGDDAREGYDIRLGGGLPLTEAITLGVSGRYIRVKAPASLRTADNVARDGDPSVKGLTLDAALGIHPSEGVHLSLLGYNLIRHDSAYVPLMAGGSISFNVGESLTLGADVLADFNTFANTTVQAGGGLEYLHENRIPLRLGYLFDSGRGYHYVGAGVGYNDDKMGVEFGLQQGVSGTNDTRAIVALRYFVH